MDNFSGQQIKGYILQERIGSGGFGAVYKAYQTTVGREVAVKIILPHFANQPDFIRRFETEAQIIARLEHLHITPLYDYWRDADGAYLVMRWLRGGSLREAIRQNPYALSDTVRVLDQIAAALAVAHANGIIHRDLKPENILLDEDGNAYLADFGIAKDLNFSSAKPDGDNIVGSPDYLSPEQARGDMVTAQTDVYSLGVVLYELLTGKHPFPGLSGVERLYKHLNDPLPLMDSLNPELQADVNAVIQKATVKNPAQRYADTLAMAEAFRQAVASVAVKPFVESLVEVLTQREQEILTFIIEGRSNKEIAEKLYVTVATVKWYITQIYRKLGVRSRVQAIVRARELNLITPAKNANAPISITGATITPTGQFQPINPYKGLRAFQAADERDFFGREALVGKLVKRLSEAGTSARFLAVIGPSGSGKSSLVKAGLIPALWHGDVPGSAKWFVAEMLPGARPLDELEVALARLAMRQTGSFREQLERDRFGLLRAAALLLPEDGSELLLVIDQFEEVFTLVEDETVRIQFLDLLHTAITEPRSRVRVVITLRADFYDRPLHYPEFGELVRSHMETILPLSAQGLERAIAKPTETVGVRFEEGLVASIVAETNYQTGALPLLQYALTELFEQRQGRLLTHAAYQQIGGAVGALAKRVEQVYGEFTPEGQAITQQMFLRLVTLGEGVEDTRRRVPGSELLSLSHNTDLADEIIDTFTEYRLFSLDHEPGTRRPTVEVAHEAILREWKRLRGWLNASREDIRLQRQLAAQAADWTAAHQESSFLLHGSRLDTFQKWTAESSLILTPAERTFLNASAAEQTRQTEAEGARQANEARLERRSQTFLRGLVTVLLVATVGALALTALAINQSQRAETQARVAQARELVGYAQNNLDKDGELSTLLALQAVNLTYSTNQTVLPEAEAVLHQAVEALHSPVRISTPALNGGTLAFSPDGSRIAYPLKSGDVFGNAYVTGIADATTGKFLYQIPGISASSISTTNQVLTEVPLNNSVSIQVWDISSNDQPKLVSSVAEPFAAWHGADGTFGIQTIWPAIDPKLRYFFGSMFDGQQRLWDLATGQEIVMSAIEKLPQANLHPTFSPDGTRLAIINPDGTLSILDSTTWEETAHLSLPNSTVNTDGFFGFSASSERLVVVNSDNTVTVWDVHTGAEIYTFYPSITPTYVALSSDGTRVAVAGNDGQVYIWNSSTKQQELAFGASDHLTEMTFSADGTRLATYHTSGQVQLWDLEPGQEALTLINHESDEEHSAVGVAYSPDGQRMIATGTSSTPNVWDMKTGQKLLALIGHTDRVLAIDWSADGRLIATAGADQTIILYDANTGTQHLTLTGHTDSIYSIAFSPDSTRLASSSFDGTIRIWDVKTGAQLLTLTQAEPSEGVTWSPDGLHLANTTQEIDSLHGGHLRIWNPRTGDQELDIPLGDTNGANLMYSPDGSRIAAAVSEDQAYYVWDVRTGEKLLTLPGHGVNTSTIAFSPDGTQIATGGFDNLAQIWDASSGKERFRLLTPTGIAYRVAFNPNGTRLAIQDQDSTTRIYVLPIVDLVALAQSRLTRTFTTEECQQYLHTDVCPAG